RNGFPICGFASRRSRFEAFDVASAGRASPRDARDYHMRSSALDVAVLGSLVTFATLTSCGGEHARRTSGAPTDGEEGGSGGAAPIAQAGAAGSCSSDCAAGDQGPPVLAGGGSAGTASAGGPAAEACDESAIVAGSPNTLTVGVDAAQQTVHKELFGVL